MKPSKNPVNWFEIYVDDIKRAQKFYEAVLDVQMLDLPMPEGAPSKMVAFPWVDNAPNAAGSLVQMEQMKAGGSGTVVYFDCEDCGIEQSRVEAAGGKVLQPKFDIGEHGFCALCIDTEGNCFGLHSMK